MYNNTIIQTNYKPYIPPPKKKAANNTNEEKSEQSKQTVTPNNYSQPDTKQQSGKDTYTKSPIEPPAAINIKQVLIDFSSTINAIGAPAEVEQEARTYLQLVETQSQKENPNKKMIVANLKMAADILDEYIATTLKKPSKVVKEWMDALLLQSIDFKANEKITKGAFESITGKQSQTEKLAEEKLAKKTIETPVVVQEPAKEEKVEDETIIKTEQPKNIDNTEETAVSKKVSEIVVSEVVQKETNPKINELISISETNAISPMNALASLSEAFKIAQAENDESSVAVIYSKIANVHNSINNIPQALDCLNASTKIAYALNDNQLKTKNHKQMGKIYDEVGFMDTALEHYCASLGLDGELDDTANQADTLNSIGKMYTLRYLKDTAVEFYKDALELAKETKSLDIMSDSFYNTAITFGNAGENDKAMSNLKNAAKLSLKSGNSQNLAEIYEKAGDYMHSMNFSKKAADLYKKSYRYNQSLYDEISLKRLEEKLQVI